MASNQEDTQEETKEETEEETKEGTEEEIREEAKEETKEEAKEETKKGEKERLRGSDVEEGIPPEDAAATTNPPRFPFPEAFYDPNTKKLMIHPLVAPNGDSYEKDSEGLDSSITYYPNRALEAYIEEELEQFAGAGSIRGKLHHWGRSMRSGWQQLLERSALPSAEYRPLSDVFYCPISFDLIHEPVIDPDGTTYEKEAILHWLKSNSNSPVTRNPLSADQVRDNNNLLRVIEFLTEEEDQDMVHPSIRRWKAEHSTRIATGPDAVPAPTPAPVPATNTSTSATDPVGRPPNQYPSNQAELDARRRQRQRMAKWTMRSLPLAIIILFIIWPYYVFIVLVYAFLLFNVFVCCYKCTKSIRARILENARAP